MAVADKLVNLADMKVAYDDNAGKISDLKSALNAVDASLFNTDKTPSEYQQGGISATGGTNTNANRVRNKGVLLLDDCSYVAINTGLLKINVFEYSSQTQADTSTFVKSVTGAKYVTGTIRFSPVEGHSYRLSVGKTDDSAITPTDTALTDITVAGIIGANEKDTEYKSTFNSVLGEITGAVLYPFGVQTLNTDQTADTTKKYIVATPSNANFGKVMVYNSVTSQWVYSGEIVSILERATEEKLSKLTGSKEIDYLDGCAIVLTGSPIDLTPVATSGFRCANISCSAGDVFTVSGRGSNNAYLYAFLNESNSIISCLKSPSEQAINMEIIAPENAVRLILNDSIGVASRKPSYYGRIDLSNEITKIKNLFSSTAEKFEILPGGVVNGVYNPSYAGSWVMKFRPQRKNISINLNGTYNRCILFRYNQPNATEVKRIPTAQLTQHDVLIYNDADVNCDYLLAIWYDPSDPDLPNFNATIVSSDNKYKEPFGVNGIPVADVNYWALQNELSSGYINASGVWTDSDYGRGVRFVVKENYNYRFALTNGHNRCILYARNSGSNYTEVKRIETAKLTDFDTLEYQNETYTELVLMVWYSTTDTPPNIVVQAYESAGVFDDFCVSGVPVATKEELVKYAPTVTYSPRFETINYPLGIDQQFTGNLHLIAIKTDNTYYGGSPNGRVPCAKGYLYLNEEEQKLYYSEQVYNNPKYLCAWNKSIAGNEDCQTFHGTITKDGDLIFFKRPYANRVRSNPIIYPHGDYDHPYVIDFGNDVKPFGFAVDSGVEHSYNGDFFMFGEYRGWSADDNDTPIYIWKVVKPYNTPSCWTRVFTQYVRHYQSAEGSHPGQEIGHFHTMNFDFYSGAWIASSGDVTYQVKFFMSKDNGETWAIQNTPQSQVSRTVGVVFVGDGMYYQTDSTNENHALYHVERGQDGYLDFSTLTKVCELSKTGAAGYGTALLQHPYGLLFIDRMEAGAAGVTELPLYFYDLKAKTLVQVYTAKAIDGYDNYDNTGRFGLPPFAYTHYQSPYEDGIIMGATSRTKPFLLDLVGNKKDILVGVLKYKLI